MESATGCLDGGGGGVGFGRLAIVRLGFAGAFEGGHCSLWGILEAKLRRMNRCGRVSKCVLERKNF